MTCVTVADLALTPTGPGLAAALAQVRLPAVPGEDLVDVLLAESRQLAHQQARTLAALVELGRALPGMRRLVRVSAWAGGEVAAALRLTGVAADRELGFAEAVVLRLPMVFAALSAGLIDRGRAWVFAGLLIDLTPEQLDAICRQWVPAAPSLTIGQLRARLVRAIHEVDPDHARRRYRRAIREREVVGYLTADGTIGVSAGGLPADEAAVALERLDVLAHAVQRAGHRGRLGQIQADLFLGLLDGSLHYLTEAQIIATLLAKRRPEDAELTDAVDVESVGKAADPDVDDVGAGDLSAAADRRAEPDQAATSEGVWADETGDGSTSASGDTEGCVEPEGAAKPEAGTGPVDGTDGAGIGPRREPSVGVEIRIGLATMLGLDQRCGEIPGLGPVLPHVARALVAAQSQGTRWRFAVTDSDGYLLLAGVTRRRPGSRTGRSGACRGGVVELHIDEELLARLAVEGSECGAWAGVVADIADQYARRQAIFARMDGRPGDRFAGPTLARHVEVRDRTCCFPGCLRSARASDKDHTRDHRAGGPTTAANTGPLCRRHHGYKTKGWWRLTQPEPGRFRWISPLGREYLTRGEPIGPVQRNGWMTRVAAQPPCRRGRAAT
jgi:hypothetical protein